jgi:hypothetical protein
MKAAKTNGTRITHYETCCVMRVPLSADGLGKWLSENSQLMLPKSLDDAMPQGIIPQAQTSFNFPDCGSLLTKANQLTPP